MPSDTSLPQRSDGWMSSGHTEGPQKGSNERLNVCLNADEAALERKHADSVANTSKSSFNSTVVDIKDQ